MSQPVLAILLTLAAGALYTLGYALAKVLSATLDPVQITFLRSVLVLAAAALWLPRAADPAGAVRRLIVPARARDQRLAGVALIVSTTIAVLGYALVPVTEASALGFTAPIILVALGAVVLREKVSSRRWVAVVLGFGGMLLVVRPDGELFTWTAAVPVLAALIYALYQVLTRRIRDVASEWDATLQGALVGVTMLGPAMPFLWRAPDLAALALVALYTAVQTAALLCLAGAVRRAEVSGLAPWHYSRIVFALGLDALLFARFPDAWALAGCALIAAAGLVLAWPKGKRPGE
ncbi:DMT family transporter [Roseomonas eburnea]|uniref:DMT family transporter n=1 Tax=Neoroseomonas eburnea TaxID=1346889 RepID=A0A9X9X6R1_9PROT|nr:DMT family transporter [Neoroseomonas eburnea]